MDCFNENRVLLELINHKNDTKLDKLPKYPFHDDETVAQVASTISEVIYDRKTTKTQRDVIIKLINKWTGNSHVINAENQDIFIDYLGNKHENINVVAVQKDWAEIVTKKYRTYLETKIKSGLIDVYNKKRFENTFDVNIPLKVLQNKKAESVVDFAEFEVKSTVAKDQELQELQEVNESVTEVILSLIKLNKVNVIHKLLTNVRTDSVWKDRLKLTPEIRKTILKNNKFIYEKVFLQYFTFVLQDWSDVTNELSEILILGFGDFVLVENMSKLMDAILMLCGCDLRVLRAINAIKNEYFK